MPGWIVRKKRLPKPDVIPPDFEPVKDFEWHENDIDYYRQQVHQWRCLRRGDYGVIFLPADTTASWIYHEIGCQRDVEQRGTAARGADGGVERIEGFPTLLVFRWEEPYTQFFGAVQRWDHVYSLIADDEPRRQAQEYPNPRDLQTLDPGDWTLISPLNAGSFGQVWRAENSSGKRAALKLLKIEHLSAGQLRSYRQHFQRELELLLKLNSPQTARALDGNATATPPWIVTEFIAGEDLDSEIAHEGPLTGFNWWTLGRDLVTGLGVAHELGIVHQDVRPPNIMRGTRGSILVDFGIATQIDRSQDFAKAYIRPRMYSSPEQIRDQRLTPASDIFQAGLTLYYAATARPAFPGRSIEEVEEALVGDKPALSQLENNQSRLLSAMLAKNPAERPDYTQCSELIKAELQAFFGR